MAGYRSTIALVAVVVLLGAGAGATTGEGDGEVARGQTELTAVADYDTIVDPGTVEFGEVIQHFGVVDAGSIIEASDPRFAGAYTWSGNRFQYPDFYIWHGAYRIENDDGAWQQTPTAWLTGQGRDPHPVTSVFTGEGAYAGWTVVAETRWGRGGFEFDGVMFEGQIPPPPAE